MACVHYYQRGWRHWLAKLPQENGVRWFPTTSREERNQLVWLIEEWMKTDEAKGLYICSTTWPDGLVPDENGRICCHSDDVGSTWFFTDPNTAFAFKMKFIV